MQLINQFTNVLTVLQGDQASIQPMYPLYQNL